MFWGGPFGPNDLVQGVINLEKGPPNNPLNLFLTSVYLVILSRHILKLIIRLWIDSRRQRKLETYLIISLLDAWLELYEVMNRWRGVTLDARKSQPILWQPNIWIDIICLYYPDIDKISNNVAIRIRLILGHF